MPATKKQRSLETASNSSSQVITQSTANLEMLPVELFLRQLGLERKRSERSGRHFVLMLLDVGRLVRHGSRPKAVDLIISVLGQSIRETDVKGWYGTSIVSVIFTEIGELDGASVAKALLSKVTDALCRTLPLEDMNEISLSFHVYPEDWEDGGPGDSGGSRLYGDLARDNEKKKVSHALKRSIDIIGSLLALAALSPLFLLIAVAIKLTSKGTVLFRQTRIGRYGQRFTFFKFRSMHAATRQDIHEEYISNYIAGTVALEGQSPERPIYKLTNDPRITPLGKFLRRTSLDEFPQFYNVLRGEMSLVGPRPPVPYEFQRYKAWHRQRLISVKPGITGLWQVEGRSKVPFDKMVRMDLEYAKSWSLWLDLKILLKTPLAVLNTDGAY